MPRSARRPKLGVKTPWIIQAVSRSLEESTPLHMKPQILLIAILAAGCLKPHLPIKENNKFCPIQSLNIDDSLTIMTVIYNTAGNPVEMANSNTSALNPFNYYFRYDKQNRLSDYFLTLAGPGEIGAFEWDHYTYPRPGIVVDSNFELAGTSTGPAPDTSVFREIIQTYQLDALGRIINTYAGTGVNGQLIGTVQYDDRGDLIRPGVTYDDKINPYQTNPVWMFITQDYSLHNPSRTSFGNTPEVIEEYNPDGLPAVLTVAEFQSEGNNFLNEFTYFTLQIVYACDGTIPASY